MLNPSELGSFIVLGFALGLSMFAIGYGFSAMRGALREGAMAD